MRLTAVALRVLDKLASGDGSTRTAAAEKAIREYAKTKGYDLEAIQAELDFEAKRK